MFNGMLPNPDMYVCEYVIYHFCILVHEKGIHVLLHTQQYVYMHVLSIIEVHIQSSTLNQTHCTHINIIGEREYRKSSQYSLRYR